MRWFRLLACAAVVAALAVLVTRPSSSASAFPTPAPCTSADLTAPYQHVDSVTSFGCAGDYAYLWATVGSAPAEVSVTELLYYDSQTSAWENALRANYCGGDLLPAYIEEKACNSN